MILQTIILFQSLSYFHQSDEIFIYLCIRSYSYSICSCLNAFIFNCYLLTVKCCWHTIFMMVVWLFLLSLIDLRLGLRVLLVFIVVWIVLWVLNLWYAIFIYYLHITRNFIYMQRSTHPHIYTYIYIYIHRIMVNIK